MSQALLVGYGTVGSWFEMTGPEGPVKGQLGAGPAGPVLSVLGPFNTITAGAAGSGRLVDIPTATFLALPQGTIAYVQSVRAYWRRFTNPTAISSDSITVLKPLGGASRDVWLRMAIPDLSSQLQSTWHVDETNGSDENTGLTQPTALASDAELNRRIGYRAPCNQFVTINTYGNVTLLQQTRLFGPNGNVVYNANGATVAFTSPAGFTAHTNYAPAANTEQDATDATVPTGTWAGAGFTPAAARPAHRVRFTAGANVGGVMWVKNEAGAGKANFSRLIVPSNDCTLGPATGVNIVNGDAYVVETLPTVAQLIVDVEFQSAGSTFFGEFVVFNNYAFTASVAFTNVLSAPSGGVRFNGCDLENLVPEVGTLFAIACNVDGPAVGQFGDAGQYWFQGCNVVAVNSGAGPTCDSGSMVFSEFTCSEACPLFVAGYNTRIFVQSGAAYRSTGPGSQVTAGGEVSVQSIFGGSGGSGVFFGANNTTAGVQLFHGAMISIRTIANVTITGANDFTMGGASSGYAWDDTNHVYAAGKRNYTWALLAIAFGGGGFGSSLFDPLSTCRAVVSAS